jgi:MFS transporter, UMF1 family
MYGNAVDTRPRRKLKNDRREIFGWITYDWANSAFYTTVVSVMLGPYLVSLAEAAVGSEGLILDLWLFRVTSGGFPAFCLALSVISMVFFLPVLGAIADYTRLKKSMMAAFCYLGVLASASLFFVKGDSYIVGGILLIISNVGFAAANVFYNAFLIDITTEDRRDRVSSWGYGAGYVGGVVMLVANLALFNNAGALGLTTSQAVRISFLAASLWWGLFALISFFMIRSRDAVRSIPPDSSVASAGFRELLETLRQLKRLRLTALFLVAYLLYNDGIQTVILQSSVFLSRELFTSAEREAGVDQPFLITIFLVAQISAFAGALVFERISRWIGAKRTVLISLVIWCGVVIYAYGFLETRFQAVFMGAIIGVVLGAAQALSRSLYSQMIPAGRESSFFGIYEISEKGTSWMGQLLFTIIIGATGSFRQAILGLIVFFVAGSIVLLFTDTDRAIHEAGNLTPEEVAAEAPA